MPIYLDSAGHLWAADREALHRFALRIGMRRAWFQDRPRLYHYDLTVPWRRRRAIEAGAIACSPRDLIHHIHVAEGRA